MAQKQWKAVGLTSIALMFMTVYPVSTAINSPHHQGEELAQPIQ